MCTKLSCPATAPGPRAVSPVTLPDGPPRAGPLTSKLQREIVLLLAWGPAILVQLAHPLVAPGVDRPHGMFRTEHCGWRRRLHRTVDAMLRLSFGTERDAQVALDRINAIHGRGHGHLPEAGPLLRGELCGLWGTASGRGSTRQCESAATLQRLRMPRPHQVQPTTGLAAPCTNRVDVFVRTDRRAAAR